jgi:outer membrane protein OmpA-like peptidoglycan-associated protein
MKRSSIILTVLGVGLFVGCAAVVPKELVSAREAYRRASTGEAARLAQVEVHAAQLALTQAEKSFADAPKSTQTRDLAYVAQRRAELAEAAASIATERGKEEEASSAFQATQGAIVEHAKSELAGSQVNLEKSQVAEAMSAERLASEQAARTQADLRAEAALSSLAAVKKDPRGMVITLSGSVLFASGQSTLLPEARTRLDHVADVLIQAGSRDLTVEGYTDSRGTDAHNLTLSQDRADAVRTYLVQHNYDAAHIRARGLGKESPVASNTNAEGRANNRRVEIVVAPATGAAPAANELSVQ